MAKELEALGPGEVQDYKVDWRERLAAAGDDTIQSSNWTLEDELTAVDDGSASGETWVFVQPAAGAVEGQTYAATNTVVTAGGRTWIRTILIPIDAR